MILSTHRNTQAPLVDFSHLHERELVAAAKTRNDSAFAELCKRNSAQVLRSVYRILKCREDAEDVLQESLIKAFAHIQEFKEEAKFSTWLTRIAINTALMELRKQRIRPSCLLDGSTWQFNIVDPSVDPEAAYERLESFERAMSALSHIKPNLRELVLMQCFDARSQKEIAKLTNLSVPAVKSRLLRAKRSLQARYCEAN